jgi:hypothetical protein
MMLASGALVVVGHGGGPWVNVYARSRRADDRGGVYTGGYERFGWNIDEQRWSYAKNPPGAAEIKN